MNTSNHIYIVKGTIREYNYCGVLNFLRKGSLYFLPHEEFTIYEEIRMREFALCDNRISIRAREKSGLFRVKRIHIRFLKDLRVEVLKNPSEKTIKYLDDNRIFYFRLNTRKQKHIEETLNHISNYKYTNPVNLKIDDELFLKGCNFTMRLKQALLNNKLEEIRRKYIKNPVRIIFTKDNRKKLKNIESYEMAGMMNEIFNNRTKELILNTNLESIYPCESCMIIGNLKIEISKEFEFKISEIQKLKQNDT